MGGCFCRCLPVFAVILRRMSQADEVNAQRALRYAWRLPSESELFDEEEISEAADAAPPSSEVLATERAQAIEEAARLAEAIDRVFCAALPVAQKARRIEALLESVSEMGTGLFALNQHPRARIRLARLCNRHWSHLSEKARESIYPAFLWMNFDHPEAVELFVEVAQTGQKTLGQHIAVLLTLGNSQLYEVDCFRGTDLGMRLIELLERADSFPHPDRTRVLALEFLDLALIPQAIPVLRKLLRRPHMGIRRRALTLLSEGFSSCPVDADEVRFLLEDLLVRPPQLTIGRRREEPILYLEAVQRVVVAIRPPDGAELLMHIANAVCNDRTLYHSRCNENWVLRTLAGAYPNHAVSLLDVALASGSWYRRLGAVEALAELPEALGRPRLLAAAADGAPEVAERARQIWLDRYFSLCPLAPLSGFPVELLVAPPSERLAMRLLVLRSPSEEARLAMLEVLLGEAPDRESLALIIFALADHHLLRAGRRKVPRSSRQMAARLYRAFGAPAIDALCWLAERYPREGGTNWFYELDKLAESSRVRKRDLEPLRQLALRRLSAPDDLSRQTAWQILGNLRPSQELLERALAMMGNRHPDSYWVLNLLKRAPRNRFLDGRIVEMAASAWAARHFDLLEDLAIVGAARRLPAFCKIAAPVVDAWLVGAKDRCSESEESGMPSLNLAVTCARHLIEMGMLPSRWVIKSLRDPSSSAFILAADMQNHDAPPAVRKALGAALNSQARAGESAEVAAIALLQMNAIDPGDPRLFEIAARAPRKTQRILLFMLAYNKAPRPCLQPLVADFLQPATQADAEDLECSIRLFAEAVGSETVLAGLEKILDTTLREHLKAEIHPQAESEPLWQDEEESTP